MQMMAQDEDIKVAFGKAIKTLREGKNISQEKLAEFAKLDRSYISHIERGKYSASIITLFKLASALDLEPNELIDKTKSLL